MWWHLALWNGPTIHHSRVRSILSPRYNVDAFLSSLNAWLDFGGEAFMVGEQRPMFIRCPEQSRLLSSSCSLSLSFLLILSQLGTRSSGLFHSKSLSTQSGYWKLRSVLKVREVCNAANRALVASIFSTVMGQLRSGQGRERGWLYISIFVA